MKHIFKFKQFEVDQSGCAMKINTDGVLLAALAESENPDYILDIGTGTGVIALMLAQRFEKAQIHAVEIEETAAATASKNFKSSIFSSRLTAIHSSIQQFNNSILKNPDNKTFEQVNNLRQYDLIVTNPPYFVNDLKNTEVKKGIARHTDEEFFNELIGKVASLLAENGKFWFILPLQQADLLIGKATDHELKLEKQLYLHSDESKPAFRKIVCLSRTAEAQHDAHFYIYESEKVYTPAYRELLKDFFLGY